MKKMPTWFKFLLGVPLIGLIIAIFAVFLSDNAADVVQGQLGKLRENKISQAYYDYTSKEFQKTTSPAAFRDFVKLYPVLSENGRFVLEEKNVSDDKGSIKGKLATDDLQEMNVEYQLVKEGKQWKILGVRLSEAGEDDNTDRVPREMVDLVEEHLKVLRDEDLDKAYDKYASQDFKEGTSLEAFKEFVKTYPVLTKYESINFKNREVETVGHVELFLNSDNVDYLIQYKLVREGGDWKIWSLKIILPQEEITKKIEATPEDLVPVVTKFLDALLLDDIKDAYNATANVFQEATSYGDFEDFVSSYPALTERKSADITSKEIAQGSGSVHVNLNDKNGVTVFEFGLGLEKGQWKIWGMKIGEQAESTPDESSYAPEETKDDSPLADLLLGVIQNQLIALRIEESLQAYEHYASEDYKARHSFSDFTNYLTLHPEFVNNRFSDFDPLQLDKNRVIMKGTITSFEDEDYPVRYDLLQEDGSWKINNFFNLSDEETMAESAFSVEESQIEAPKSFEFTSIVVGTEVDEDGVVKAPKKVIDREEGFLYFNVQINNGIAGTEVSLALEHIDSGSKAPPLSTVLEEEGNSEISFSFAAPAFNWPEGAYLVTVTSPSRQEITQTFQVQ